MQPLMRTVLDSASQFIFHIGRSLTAGTIRKNRLSLKMQTDDFDGRYFTDEWYVKYDQNCVGVLLSSRSKWRVASHGQGATHSPSRKKCMWKNCILNACTCLSWINVFNYSLLLGATFLLYPLCSEWIYNLQPHQSSFMYMYILEPDVSTVFCIYFILVGLWGVANSANDQLHYKCMQGNGLYGTMRSWQNTEKHIYIFPYYNYNYIHTHNTHTHMHTHTRTHTHTLGVTSTGHHLLALICILPQPLFLMHTRFSL